jgi:hypothetical protein
MEKSSQEKASFGQGLELANILNKAIANAVKKTGASSDDVQKLINKPGVIYKCVENLFSDSVVTKPSILKLISVGEKIMIESSDGKALISKAKNTFKSSIDFDFTNFKLNKAGIATYETLLDVYEMANDATFVQMFSELNSDLDKLAMTQAQIIRFCEKHPTWLRQEGYPTFFLIKVNGEYFVVCVSMGSGGLDVHVYRLEDDSVSVWGAEHRHRVVAPQLETLPA